MKFIKLLIKMAGILFTPWEPPEEGFHFKELEQYKHMKEIM